MKFQALRALALALVAAGSAEAQTPLKEARSALEKWAETRQLISRTRAEWQSDKELLTQTISLLEREYKSYDDRISALGTNSLQVGKERAEAEALLKASEAGLETGREFAATTEREIRTLLPRLPVPLQESLKPMVNRFPGDSSATKMPATERVQVVVGVLNELDKFNNAISVFSEKRRSPSGEDVSVETVYVGLGAAYFVSSGNDLAGTGVPGAQAWEWTTRPELARSVREVVKMYRNELPARFVALPATIR